MKILIGPISSAPSWSWIGESLSLELKKLGFKVELFPQFQCMSTANVAIFIKQPPTYKELKKLNSSRTKILYCPVDFFSSYARFNFWKPIIAKADGFMLHCKRLYSLFSDFHKPIFNVEHHAKYALDIVPEYKESGYVLWIGGCQYLPYVVSWIRQYPINAEIKLLTDINNKRAVETSKKVFKWMGISTGVTSQSKSIEGMQILQWSEELQQEMLRECKAAFDIKGVCFGQRYKPATKAQKYVSNGIPFAVNSESYSWEYLKSIGFNACTPKETDKWFSKEYWHQTQRIRDQVKRDTAIDVVVGRFVSAIKELSTCR